MSLPQVEACAVSLYEGSRLLAFVVTSTSGDQKAASPLPPAQQHAEQTPLASAECQEDDERHGVETGGADGDLSGLILNQLSLLLPSYSVPDTLVLIPALSLTPHGEHRTRMRKKGSILGILMVCFCLLFFDRKSRHAGTYENLSKTERVFRV